MKPEQINSLMLLDSEMTFKEMI